MLQNFYLASTASFSFNRIVFLIRFLRIRTEEALLPHSSLRRVQDEDELLPVVLSRFRRETHIIHSTFAVPLLISDAGFVFHLARDHDEQMSSPNSHRESGISYRYTSENVGNNLIEFALVFHRNESLSDFCSKWYNLSTRSVQQAFSGPADTTWMSPKWPLHVLTSQSLLSFVGF